MKTHLTRIRGHYLLKKFPGKGGWTYAEIPELTPDASNPFGWVTISGTIDAVTVRRHKLMPMGNGRLFLSLKSSLRKQLGKEAGDRIRVDLFVDATPVDTPREILDCLALEPVPVRKAYDALSESKRKHFLDWIYAARTEPTKARRIAKMIDQLLTAQS